MSTSTALLIRSPHSNHACSTTCRRHAFGWLDPKPLVCNSPLFPRGNALRLLKNYIDWEPAHIANSWQTDVRLAGMALVGYRIDDRAIHVVEILQDLLLKSADKKYVIATFDDVEDVLDKFGSA